MSDGRHSQEDAFGLPAPVGSRYYFDIHDGERLTRDDTGVECSSLKAAQDEAVTTLAEVAKDALPDGTRREFLIEVRDESGRKLLRATLGLTVAML